MPKNNLNKNNNYLAKPATGKKSGFPDHAFTKILQWLFFLTLQKTSIMPFPTNIDILPAASWLSLREGMVVIAGPCSVESKHQFEETARQLASGGKLSAIRAGVWKPRSRPGEFEGIGEKAMPWLKDSRAETGLPLAVEVARPRHAETCLKHGIDIIWLGARTTVNPFMVQEIANVIRGTGIPVMVKNPVSPDLRLWIGAIERIFNAGTNKIIALHRGFHTHENKTSRNLPLWEIPLELKKIIPGIPVICDPSHIAGNRAGLAEITETALGLNMDGLIIESHYRPDEALTDSSQQITPEAMHELINMALATSERKDISRPLQAMRERIDNYDHTLLELLAGRFGVSSEIGRIKRKKGEVIVQKNRQEHILNDRMQKSKSLGLSPEFTRKLLQLLHDESVNYQQKEKDEK